MLLIQPTGLSHPKKRCQDCAGEPVPDDIKEEGGEPSSTPTIPHKPIERMTRMSLGDLKQAAGRFDYKQAQSGD